MLFHDRPPEEDLHLSFVTTKNRIFSCQTALVAIKCLIIQRKFISAPFCFVFFSFFGFGCILQHPSSLLRPSRNLFFHCFPLFILNPQLDQQDQIRILPLFLSYHHHGPNQVSPPSSSLGPLQVHSPPRAHCSQCDSYSYPIKEPGRLVRHKLRRHCHRVQLTDKGECLFLYFMLLSSLMPILNISHQSHSGCLC